MKILANLFLFLSFLSMVNGQDTIWVKEGKKSKMYQVDGEWFFKDNLPDGHYCSYYDKEKYIAVEVTFKNGKKDGIENQYFSYSDDKYATITWKNGKKNGAEIHYNGDGSIDYLLLFMDNELNGPFEVNWHDCVTDYKGFYKNGYRDSIWTYYDTGNKYQDTTDYWIDAQYLYKDGRPFLISKWDKHGLKTIVDGKGIDINKQYSYIITTNYENGMKNGEEILSNLDGTFIKNSIYKDNLLSKEIIYYDSNKVSSISEWCYNIIPKVDTIRSSIDTYITDIYYNEIEYNYTPVKNGHWVYYYSNGNKIYEGNYLNGKRIGVWYWGFPNGKPKVIGDYSNNNWQHFDTTGKIISQLKMEYLTLLTENAWELTKPLEESVIILNSFRSPPINMFLNFQPDGQVNFYSPVWWESFPIKNKFSLSVDTLTIYTKNYENDTQQIYKFLITNATLDNITLNRIK
jgi:antitoxin component YwqK of YwqJK toxin-antitoxin module